MIIGRMVLACALVASLVILQVVFMQFERIDSSRTMNSLRAIIKDEQVLLNPQKLTQTLLDFKALGLISCLRVSSHSDDTVFLDQSVSAECENSDFSLAGKRVQEELKSSNGQIWNISLKTNNPTMFYITLWICRMVLVLAVLLLYYLSRVREQFHSRIFQIEQSKLQLVENIAVQVSHDIRSPLSAIGMGISNSDLSLERKRIVEAAVSRIESIASELLERSRTTGTIRPDQTMRVESKSVSLVATMNQVIGEQRLRYHQASELDFELDSDDSDLAMNDRDALSLSRCVSNLVSNSVEAMNGRGTVKVSLRKYPNKTLISIQDNGPGIPSEILSKLGIEKVSSGQRGTKSGNGTGVLSSKRTVEKIGGSLTILSRPGFGTSMQISIPG